MVKLVPPMSAETHDAFTSMLRPGISPHDLAHALQVMDGMSWWQRNELLRCAREGFLP